MKERGERWLILPFSLGCASRSSVAAATPSQPKNVTLTGKRRYHESSLIVKKSKYSIGFSLPKPNLSLGIRKLIKRLKSVSQIFAYRDEYDNEEAEMEIGHPTDVKHLTHIGWDGSTTITNHQVKGNINPPLPPDIISFPSISLKQFELAMAAQAQGIIAH